MAWASPAPGRTGTATAALPQPFAGQTVDWSQTGAQPGWNYAADPLNAALQVGYNPTSGAWDMSDPSQATGDRASGMDPTSFAAAQADFNQLDPSAAQPAPQPNQQLVNALAQPAYETAPTLQTPTYATPAANVTGAQLSTSNVDPALLAALSPQAAEQLTMQGAAPMWERQDRLLQQQLADAGIVGGPSTTAGDELAQSQAAGIAPALAGEVQNSQGNLLSAAGTGTGNQQAASLANQGIQQGTNLANQGAANTANSQNVGAVNTTNQNNTTTYNNQIAALMALLNGQSTTQAGQYGGVTNATQTGASNIAQTGANAYGVPTTTGGANSLANAAGAATKTAAQTNPVIPSTTPAASQWA